MLSILLIKGRFKDFSQPTELYFLISVFLGGGIAIISGARLFDYLFQHYPVYIWAYFFGLILASVYFVGKTIEKWSLWVIVSLIAGAAFAWFITTMKPATQNEDFLYLIICGVVAVCSMILPGLSGSLSDTHGQLPVDRHRCHQPAQNGYSFACIIGCCCRITRILPLSFMGIPEVQK